MSSIDTADAKYFTTEELTQYNGKDENTPIYISIKGVVYDVSSGRSFYSVGSNYHVFAGREASRALALMSTDEKDISNTSLDDLDDDQLNTLNEWIKKFESKYPVVGYLKDSKY